MKLIFACYFFLLKIDSEIKVDFTNNVRRKKTAFTLIKGSGEKSVGLYELIFLTFLHNKFDF